ncbi:AAA family ATPase [Patescibacteria group bacterium]|nr:AAA family ATPase [Candidatus Micrarchaeota archaeon]MBU1758358.1 AAA family ATPase [Patescibacteria group bacterium]
MSNYFDDNDTYSSIIISEEILLPDYLPDDLIHRNKELQSIADSIKPIIKKRTPDNLFIHGPSGSGKTCCIKHILKQLSSYSTAILPVYVNCWENQTQMAIYNRIIEEMRLPLPRRGLATDEIFSKICEYAKNYKKPILLVLDELDGLRHMELLYVVARANEKMLMFGIIGISNNKELLSKLDTRIRSSLRFSEMEFKHYSEEELISILKLRAEKALTKTSFDERLLAKIARSAEDGSARIAISLLWKSAKHAEKAGRAKIMLQDLEDILSEQPSYKDEFNLSAEELLILELLKNGKLQSSDIYDAFIKKIPKTKRQIRNYLDLLEKKGIIESEKFEADGILRPKVFRLK